jgi:hypothetical protein
MDKHLCKHVNGTDPEYDHVICRNCRSILTDGEWGVASRQWFGSVSEAKLYQQTGRLPDATVIARLEAENARLRQQLAEQTSGEHVGYVSADKFNSFGAMLKVLPVGTKLYTAPPSVEVLLEALRLAKITFISNRMDVRNVMEVIDDALNAYSAKPKKQDYFNKIAGLI